MMSKRTSYQLLILKKAALVPVLVLIIFFFCTKVEAKINNSYLEALKTPFDLKKLWTESVTPTYQPKKLLPPTISTKLKPQAEQSSSRTILSNELEMASTTTSVSEISDSVALKPPLAESKQRVQTTSNGVYVSDEKITLTIDRNATPEQLKSYQDILSLNAINLNIKQIEYDENQKIGYIEMAVYCDAGFSGKISTTLTGSRKMGFNLLLQANGDSNSKSFQMF